MAVWNIILAAVVACIVWFIAGAILYLNPMSKHIQDRLKKDPGVKKWHSQNDQFIQILLVGTVIPSLLWAIAFVFVSPLLPASNLMQTGYFGLLLVGVYVIPRFTHTSVMASYPGKMLIMDLINGTLVSFVIAGVYAYML